MKLASSFRPAAPPAALICSIARLTALTWVSFSPASGPLSISSTPILTVSSAKAAVVTARAIAAPIVTVRNALKAGPMDDVFMFLSPPFSDLPLQGHERLVLRRTDGADGARPDNFPLRQDHETIRRTLDETQVLLDHEHAGA